MSKPLSSAAKRITKELRDMQNDPRKSSVTLPANVLTSITC